MKSQRFDFVQSAKHCLNYYNILILDLDIIQYLLMCFNSRNISFQVQFSHSVVFDSLWHQSLQHARLPCPSPTPRTYSNSYRLNQWWCSPTVSSSVIPFSSRLQSFPTSGVSSESVLLIRWPKYWSFSFSISLSNEYSGLISFRIDWLGLLAVQGTLKTIFSNATAHKH